MTKAEKFERIIEVTEELIIGEAITQTEEYNELSKENRMAFKGIMTEIEKINDEVTRKRLKRLLVQYNECEANYHGFGTRYAYQEGAKLGYGLGVSERNI